MQEQKERDEANKKLEKMNAAKEREKRVREELQAKEKKARQAQSFVDQIDQFESKVFPHAASESPIQKAEAAQIGDSKPTTAESPRSSYQQRQTSNSKKSSTKRSVATPNDEFPLSESDKTQIVDFIQRAKMDPFTHLKTLATKLLVAQVSHQQTAAYLASIKAQKGQEHVAKKERDLRRRKLLLSEQVAQEDLEKTKMEELMAQKLQRHSKQERRIAEQ
jgi:hypothetical protein